MVQTANTSYVVPCGSAFLYAVRLINNVTRADFIIADISSITETITDTVTDVAVTRSLTVADVVFDTLQTNQIIASGDYEYNVLVLVPATKIVARRKYRYQLTVVPKDGAGDPDTDNTHKTEEIDIVGD